MKARPDGCAGSRWWTRPLAAVAVAAAVVLILPTAMLAGADPQGGRGHGPRGRGRGMGPGGGMSAEEHGNIFALLSGHATVKRTVEEIPGGVRTTTTTTDPELVPALREHVRQMEKRLRDGRWVRPWDPVFRAVFEHADEIELTWEDVEGGIAVVETSEDVEVVPMIRAHARKVDEFVAGGHAAARPPWAGGMSKAKGKGHGHGQGKGQGPGPRGKPGP